MGQDDSTAGRLDREVSELLNEPRVALPGVRVLFAFLLILPLSTGFTDLSTYPDVIVLASLLRTAGATAMLVAHAMSRVVFLVAHVMLVRAAAVVVSVLTTGVFVVLWFALPLTGGWGAERLEGSRASRGWRSGRGNSLRPPRPVRDGAGRHRCNG